MARWAPFLGLAVVLAIVVLLIARRSTAMLRDPDALSSPERAPTLGEPAADQPTTLEDPHAVAPPPREPVELSPALLLANVLVTQGVLAGIVVGGIVLFEIPGSAVGLGSGPWVWGLDALGLGLALGVGLWLGSEGAGRLADAAGVTYDEGLREMLAPDTAAGWLLLVFVVLPIIAGAEELLFRAALVGVPAAALEVSPWVFVVASSALFALGHGAQGRVGIAATGVLGLALGAAFVLTESLVVVVLAHYVVNVLEFGVHELVGLD